MRQHPGTQRDPHPRPRSSQWPRVCTAVWLWPMGTGQDALAPTAGWNHMHRGGVEPAKPPQAPDSRHLAPFQSRYWHNGLVRPDLRSYRVKTINRDPSMFLCNARGSESQFPIRLVPWLNTFNWVAHTPTLTVTPPIFTASGLCFFTGQFFSLCLPPGHVHIFCSRLFLFTAATVHTTEYIHACLCSGEEWFTVTNT